MSEYRKNPVINRWTIIAPEKKIPYKRIREKFISEPKEKERDCPFCSRITNAKILLQYSSENDITTVIPHPMPFLKVETQLKKEGDGIYDIISGTGANEIIIESEYHHKHPHNGSKTTTANTFKAAKERMIDLKNDIRLEYILFYRDFSKTIDNLPVHPHSKLTATPFIPPLIENELIEAENYFSYKERCVFCDILKQELREEKRIVFKNKQFAAICPYASRFPFEVWIIPLTHTSDFEKTKEWEMEKLSETYCLVLEKINKKLGNIPYQTVLHNSPLKEENLEYYHWHIEIYPNITELTGAQKGGELYVNPVTPEEAAKALLT